MSTPKHILLLEDRINIAYFVGDILNNAGFTYDWYKNPCIAFEKIEETPVVYDAIVCDWNMPPTCSRLSMDGDRVLHQVRKGHLIKCGIPQDIPFVMCSAFDDEEHINKALNWGADLYQVKDPTTPLSEMVNYLQSLP